MGTAPAAWVPEAPLNVAADREVADRLSHGKNDYYFNAGVMLINVQEWKKQKISEQCMEYIAQYRPEYHDQSAMNFVLFRNAIVLEDKFNFISNMRKNWSVLKKPYGQIDRLIHFLDYPKPWDLGSEIIHPYYPLWKSVLKKTALLNFRSWDRTPSRKIPRNQKAQSGYQKALKDRLLFMAYSKGWIKRVKGL